ncbi:hypothetical protein MVES1_003630 [Malassezia vespertilionis]|uniref:Kinesin motor domain-containing protein n=1 Tax=Malassezia vespertilionis TaxID=2020962 RepID=A0A2N1J8N7_9BASI|nr:uncharacterized protein MVES1_003630 [Malassezia vespertilionis]PKI82925.1 hypothetical protein MVES_003201 [Malassezia vespertilionis]WFD08258.1 hypothetical protein MVES1_003630 [Malassezia vespertilionis]
MAAHVKVVARFRPVDTEDSLAVLVEDAQTVRMMRGAADLNAAFTFDRVFPMHAHQRDVFEYGIMDTVSDVLRGYNGTIFAYGQTGSGKTHTMMGPDIDHEELRGIIPRITEQIFSNILASPPALEYTVKVSYMEIYMERIRDLLVPQHDNLSIQQDTSKGVHVKGLSEYYVSSAAEVFELLRQGSTTRAVSATRMNTESSRSHSIVLFTIKQRNIETGSTKTGNLYLVDLAGSEKVGKSGASGQTLEEAKKINKSLSTLGMVINALTDGRSSHVPYRDSKLTRILQESLGGNSRTTLLVNCSPTAYNAEETLSTLRFGVRAKRIQNNAHVNAELSPMELRVMLQKANQQSAHYRKQIDTLERELVQWRAGESVPQSAWASTSVHASPVRSPTRSTVSLAETDELHEQLAEKEGIEQALRKELGTARTQTSEANERIFTLETEIQALQLHSDALAFARDEAVAQIEIVREMPPPAAPPIEREKGRDERLEDMFASLQLEHRPGVDTILALVDRLSLPGGQLSPEEVRMLRDTIIQEQVMLSEQIHTVRIHAQELSVLRLQKHALSERIGALQQRYDLITDHIGALEHGFRLGDETGGQLASLRRMLEEQTTASQLNTSNEVLHLEGLLTTRAEETVDLARSLDDLRASHDEQKQALHHLRLAVTADGTEAGPEAMQRLVDASELMEKSRELVTVRLREYERLKQQLMQGLRERSEKIVEMEMAMEEMQDQYKMLLETLNLRVQQRKMGILERHLEQLASVQRRLVEQNSALKQDMATADKRVAARNERIQALEEDLYATRQRLKVREERAMQDTENFSFGRIAKPMRGAGAVDASELKPKGGWFFSAK